MLFFSLHIHYGCCHCLYSCMQVHYVCFLLLHIIFYLRGMEGMGGVLAPRGALPGRLVFLGQARCSLAGLQSLLQAPGHPVHLYFCVVYFVREGCCLISYFSYCCLHPPHLTFHLLDEQGYPPAGLSSHSLSPMAAKVASSGRLGTARQAGS